MQNLNIEPLLIQNRIREKINPKPSLISVLILFLPIYATTYIPLPISEEASSIIYYTSTVLFLTFSLSALANRPQKTSIWISLLYALACFITVHLTSNLLASQIIQSFNETLPYDDSPFQQNQDIQVSNQAGTLFLTFISVSLTLSTLSTTLVLALLSHILIKTLINDEDIGGFTITNRAPKSRNPFKRSCYILRATQDVLVPWAIQLSTNIKFFINISILAALIHPSLQTTSLYSRVIESSLQLSSFIDKQRVKSMAEIFSDPEITNEVGTKLVYNFTANLEQVFSSPIISLIIFRILIEIYDITLKNITTS